jgi:imidazolonepropionase-like amidohydrolase
VSTYRVSGVLLPSGEHVRLWIDRGVISTAPPALPSAAASTVDELAGGFIVPGLVDAHCHVGIGPEGGVSLEEAAEQARTDRDGGALLIRDCGSPIDTRPLQSMPELPRLIRAGRHIARPKRYLASLGVELDSEDQLPEAVAEQARRGDGWVKLVGDWIDRTAGDLRPLWSDEALAKAVETAHEHGARVTAHVFGADAIPGLIAAGIDCLEHATGVPLDAITELAARGVAVVPTLINIENFPGIAERATKFPRYAEHMRKLHAGVRERIGAAIEAGVPVYAGSDAGGGITHGHIVDEIIALHRTGMSRLDALGAASWRARHWLGLPSMAGSAADGTADGSLDGVAADLLVYDADPREDLSVLRHPKHIVLRGRVIR